MATEDMHTYVYICMCMYNTHNWIFSSVQFSRSVMANSLQPHELQHTRPPCPGDTGWPGWTPGTHVHRVGDAIQPSHPLSSPSPPAPIPPSIRVFSYESILGYRNIKSMETLWYFAGTGRNRRKLFKIKKLLE